MFFLVSVEDGGRVSSRTQGVIIDAQELVRGEIWTITVRLSPSLTETLYVLEPTCEVIGYLPSNPGVLAPKYTVNPVHVRADWSTYVAERLLPSSMHALPLSSLIEHLQWTNREEYDRGISKLWLKRIANEGDSGKAKKVVARRYILACVVGNGCVAVQALVSFPSDI